MIQQFKLLILLSALFIGQTTFAEEQLTPGDEAEKVNIVKFTGGLGVGYNTYNSTVVSISQYSLITKFGASYRNKNLDKWILSLSSFFTALPFNSTAVNIGGVADTVTIRYLGVNARVGWDTPWLTNGWKLQLNLGWYYNTTFVTHDRFGYVGANGPQFFPTLEYQIDENQAVGGYLKFSPMSSGFSFLNSSTNYEVAVGAYYMPAGMLFEKFKYTINFDFAHLSMKPDAVRAYSNSTTLGMSVVF